MSDGSRDEETELVPALRLRAEREPEQPALFFRGPRGHFRWWSWGRLLSEIEAAPDSWKGSSEGGESVPRELVSALLDPALAAFLPAARELLGRLDAGSEPERDIWICSRSLELSTERNVIVAALLGGWAIVREPVAPLPAETFAWARPTILSGAADELASLLERFEAEAPRFRRERWLRRRVERLRAVIVDGAGTEAPVAGRLAALGSAAHLIPLSPPSLDLSTVVQESREGEPR